MTPQDIREKTFEKAVFGGYDMDTVDKFLEEVSADFTSLQKENSVLKNKMKVLVDKIEEYRATEDAMRMALLSAQKMGSDIEKEAREKSEAMLNDAKQTSQAMLSDAKQTSESMLSMAKSEVLTEEARLFEAKKRTAEYLERMRMICNMQLDFFDALGDMKLGEEGELQPPSHQAQSEQPQQTSAPVQPRQTLLEDPVFEETAQNRPEPTGASFSMLEPEDVMNMSADSPNIPDEPALDMDDVDEPTKLFTIPRDISPEDLTPRPKFKFQDLRFGENYDPDE